MSEVAIYVDNRQCTSAVSTSLHALLGVPRALQLADNNHLPHVIRIVRPDLRDFRSPSLQLLVIGGFDKVFQFGHQLVELLDRVVPLLGVKVVKGFVIVAAEFFFGFYLASSRLFQNSR